MISADLRGLSHSDILTGSINIINAIKRAEDFHRGNWLRLEKRQQYLTAALGSAESTDMVWQLSASFRQVSR